MGNEKAIKYRLFPDDEQKTLLQKTFGCVRLVYNESISINQGLYAAGMKSFSKYDMNNYCNRIMKDDLPYLKEVDKFALTNSIYHAFFAFKNFFDGRTNFPRFKSRKDRNQSYTTNKTNGNIAIIHKPKRRGFVKLPKIGKVAASIHRMPSDGWIIKTATVSKDSGDRYYVSILFSVPDTEKAHETPLPTINSTLGLDYSSQEFFVDSNGNTADVQHWYRKSEKRLAVEQRKLSNCKKGSNRYEKQKQKVNHLHRKVANQRLDFCHKRSREIANSYNAVCVEDLNLHEMAQTLRFGKAISDNGFGMFRRFLQYKMEDQGKYYIVIDKWYPSTKTCHHCGNVNPDVKLGQAQWVCPHCGKLVMRDHNAAINIRDEGLRIFYEAMVTV